MLARRRNARRSASSRPDPILASRDPAQTPAIMYVPEAGMSSRHRHSDDDKSTICGCLIRMVHTQRDVQKDRDRVISNVWQSSFIKRNKGARGMIV
jgi:hypothetical protein